MFQLYHKYLKKASKYGSMRNDLLHNCMDSYSIIDNNDKGERKMLIALY